MFTQFHPTQEGNLNARFLSIQQTGRVEEYPQLFKDMPASLPHLTDDDEERIMVILGKFIIIGQSLLPSFAF